MVVASDDGILIGFRPADCQLRRVMEAEAGAPALARIEVTLRASGGEGGGRVCCVGVVSRGGVGYGGLTCRDVRVGDGLEVARFMSRRAFNLHIKYPPGESGRGSLVWHVNRIA